MYAKKNTINKIVYGLAAFLLVSIAWIGSSSAAEEPLLIQLAATTIKISTFYNGTTLEVSGRVPEDKDVVLTVSGPKKEGKGCRFSMDE